jgi:hypothetical protein
MQAENADSLEQDGEGSDPLRRNQSGLSGETCGRKMECAGKGMGSPLRRNKDAWINPPDRQMICIIIGKSLMTVNEAFFIEYSQTSLPNIGKTHHFAHIWKMIVQL